MKVESPLVWNALIRRIHKVIRFMSDGTRRKYTTQEYLSGAADFVEISPEEQKVMDGLFPSSTEARPY